MGVPETAKPLVGAQLLAAVNKPHSTATQTLWHRQLLDSPKNSTKGLAKLATPG